MLIYSMGVSVDGFIADREGAFGWSAPSEELFRFHTALVSELGGYLLGRRLYETMLVWETDPSLREDELGAAFADVWCAIPKVVFSRTLDSVQGNARLAQASLAEEVGAALEATDKDVGIGGAGPGAPAIAHLANAARAPRRLACRSAPPPLRRAVASSPARRPARGAVLAPSRGARSRGASVREIACAGLARAVPAA